MCNEESGLGGAAASELRRLFEEFVGPRTQPKRASPSNLVEPYLQHLRSIRTPRYCRSTATQLRRVVLACPNATTIEVVAYQARRAQDKTPGGLPVTNRTVNAETSALRACLRWAASVGLIEGDPLACLKPLPQRAVDKRKRRRALTEAEIARLLEASTRQDRRRMFAQTPFWRTIIETGLRFGEAAGLTPSDLKGETLIVRPENSKTGQGRRVPISPALAKTLSRLRHAKALFVTPEGVPWRDANQRNAQRVLELALHSAKIPYLTGRDDSPKPPRHGYLKGSRSVDVHALRKTAATRMLRRGVPIETVSRVLGHSSIDTTASYYVDLSVEDDRVKLRAAWGGSSEA